jgi:hypothetical protein
MAGRGAGWRASTEWRAESVVFKGRIRRALRVHGCHQTSVMHLAATYGVLDGQTVPILANAYTIRARTAAPAFAGGGHRPDRRELPQLLNNVAAGGVVTADWTGRLVRPACGWICYNLCGRAALPDHLG